MTADDAAPLLRRVRDRDPRDRPRVRRARGLSQVPASRSSSRRCIRATRARSASACMAELVAARARARATRARLRHRLQHRRRGGRPPRPLARHPRRARRRRLRSRAGTGWVSSCRPTRSARARHRLARRARAAASPAADGAARQGRVLGHRDQARAGATGCADYPVFTRKVAHRRRLSRVREGDARARPTRSIRSSRATTRSRSPRSTRWPATPRYEFQCLHGMGESIYDQVVGQDKLDRACRIYAPVGSHETLLAYLVRRLPRERRQHARSSTASSIRPCSIASAGRRSGRACAERPAARRIRRSRCPSRCMPGRRNSQGIDFLRRRRAARARRATLAAVAGAVDARADARRATMLCSRGTAARCAIRADRRRRRRHGDRGDAPRTSRMPSIVAVEQGPAWSNTPAAERAACLERAADLLEARTRRR